MQNIKPHKMRCKQIIKSSITPPIALKKPRRKKPFIGVIVRIWGQHNTLYLKIKLKVPYLRAS
ncbi:MAG: hypothetical protein DRR19_25235 [Candidatus Parabeggiatoa sp. nov. 1]|nr:MAG: hypothetical protein DRR19_25235 [Gammaproteobacteria bacterium]